MEYGTLTIPLGRAGKYGQLQVDTTKLNDTITRYVYEYGLRQCLNDAMADKTDDDGNALTPDVIVAKAQKRLDNLYAGVLRTRSDAEPADPVEAELHKLVKSAVALGLKKYTIAVPKGTKDRLLFAYNARRVAMHQQPVEDTAAMVAMVLETAPIAKDLRKQAERNVRERAAIEI